MKKLVIALFLCCPAAWCEVPARTVAEQVQKAIREANQRGLAGLKLQKAVLNLETIQKVGAGGKLEFLVVTASGSGSVSQTQTISLVYERITPASGSVFELKDPLAKAITAAAELAKEMNVPPLELREASVRIEFAVETEAGGGVSFKILKLGAEATGTVSREAKHSLEVVFAGR